MIGTVVFVAAVGIYTAIAAVVDVRTRRIPNALTVPAALLGLAFHALTPGSMGLLMSLAGFGVGFGLLLIPWLLGGGGMGDVKLLAALGAWLGPKWVLVAFAAAGLFAAVIALVLLSKNILARGVVKAFKDFAKGLRTGNKPGQRRPRKALPFAVPVAMSTWVLLAWLVTRGAL